MAVVLWTLKRARRIAAAVTNRNPAAHPRRFSGHRPQVKARIAGAMPNDTTSASESSSTPKAVEEFRQPRDEPVQRVENHGDADEERRRIEVGTRRINDTA